MTTSPTGIEERLDALTDAVTAMLAQLGESKTETLLDGVEAIAETLGIPVRSIQHMIEAHGLPVIRMGRRIYGRRSTLNAWLAEQEAKARSAAHGG